MPNITYTVKYHNDFNKVQLPNFTEQEQNLLFSILAKIKDREDGKPIRLFMKDIIVGKVESREHFTAVMESLKTKFFKANFRQIIETDTEIIDSHFHLFNTMDIHYQKKNPDDGYDNSKIFCYIDLAVNSRFRYLLKELTANFTRFELEEFVLLNGKYTKTLYRLLKQFRNTGKFKMDWEQFCSIMQIPKNYGSNNIEQRILKPAIKELSSPKTLFDQQRIPFKNLRYEKIKQKGTRGQGGKVIGIEFSFTPEKTESEQTQEHVIEQQKQIIEQQTQELKTKKQENTDLQEKIFNIFGKSSRTANYIGNTYENEKGYYIKIIDIIEYQDELKVVFRNMENESTFNKYFPTHNHLKSYLSKFYHAD